MTELQQERQNMAQFAAGARPTATTVGRGSMLTCRCRRGLRRTSAGQNQSIGTPALALHGENNVVGEVGARQTPRREGECLQEHAPAQGIHKAIF